MKIKTFLIDGYILSIFMYDDIRDLFCEKDER